MKFRIKKKHWPIIAVVALIVVFVVRIQLNSAVTQEDQEDVVKKVTLLDLNTFRDSARTLEASGQVESLEQVELKSEVFAPVARVFTSLGANVRPGQTLVTFRNADLAADLQQARASYDAALAQQAVQQANLDKVKTASANSVSAARSALKTAENNLNINPTEPTGTVVTDAYADLRVLLRSTHATINSAFVSADSIVGVESKAINDAFEVELANQNQSLFNTAATKYRQALNKKLDVDRVMQDINTATFPYLDTMASSMSLLLTDVSDMYTDLTTLLNSVVATGGGLTQTKLDSLRTNTNTADSNVSKAQTALVNQIQAVSSAKTSLSGTQIAYDKALQDLNDTIARTDADIALAQASLQAQQAQVNSASASINKINALLAKTIIRSPISGTVAVLPAKVGELMSSGELVVSVVNTNGLQIKAFVDSAELEDIAVGNTALVQGKYAASVAHVAPSIDPQTKKVEVVVAVTDTDASLVVGQFVDVEIRKSAEVDAGILSILLPLESVKISAEGTFVYIVSDENMIERKEVQVDRIIGNKVEVVSGHEELEAIVATVGGFDVGQTVEPRISQ